LLDIFLHLNSHLAALLAQYGTLTYAILFLIVFCETGLVFMPWLPGDSLLFAAGALASSTGNLDPYTLILVLICAALLGDNTNYLVGKFFGKTIKSRERIGFFKREYIEQTESYYARYGGRTIIMARFIPIIRTVAPFVAGAGNMHYPRYMQFCVLGAVLWVGLITTAGYQFGHFEVVKNNFEFVVLGIVAVSLMPLAFQLGQKLLNKTKTV